MKFESKTVPQKVWNKICYMYGSGCWAWEGTTDRGLPIYMIGRGNKSVRRYLYEKAYGPVQRGDCVEVNCDRRDCVNPRHMWVRYKNERVSV